MIFSHYPPKGYLVSNMSKVIENTDELVQAEQTCVQCCCDILQAHQPVMLRGAQTPACLQALQELHNHSSDKGM